MEVLALVMRSCKRGATALASLNTKKTKTKAGKTITNCQMELLSKVSHKGNGALRCGGAFEIPTSCCMPGDGTHAVVTWPKWV